MTERRAPYRVKAERAAEPFRVAFTVEGNPLPKERPRVVLNNGTRPHGFTPRRTMEWEAAVG
jgi:hypothetical protein